MVPNDTMRPISQLTSRISRRRRLFVATVLGLSLLAAGVNGLRGAQSVAVSHDGHRIYVAGFHDDAVAAFERRFHVTLPLVMQNS